MLAINLRITYNTPFTWETPCLLTQPERGITIGGQSNHIGSEIAPDQALPSDIEPIIDSRSPIVNSGGAEGAIEPWGTALEFIAMAGYKRKGGPEFLRAPLFMTRSQFYRLLLDPTAV